MKINKHNYEAFLLDQIDGRLSKQQSALLKAFIDGHPELGSWQQLTASLPVITAGELRFPDKEMLLNISAEHFDADEAMIAAHEGLATDNALKNLHNYLADNPEAQKSWRYYALAFLKADKNIVFPDKHKLMRPLFLLHGRQLQTLGVAAALALLLGWGWWFLRVDNLQQAEKMQLSVVENHPQGQLPTKSESLETTREKEAAAVEISKARKKTPQKTGKSKNTSSTPAKKQSNAPRQSALPPMPNGNGLIQLNLSLNETHFMYYEPSLDERLALASILEQMPEFAPPRHRNATERVAGNLFGKALARLQGPAGSRKPAETFSLWNLASSGVSAYNFLTDKDVQLIRATGENGQTAVFLDSDNFSFDRKKVTE